MALQITNGTEWDHFGGDISVLTSMGSGGSFTLQARCADGTFRAVADAVTTSGVTTFWLPVRVRLKAVTSGTVNYAEVMG